MGVKLFITGQLACFSRPELSVERVSYDAMTPSAAVGVLEAIYWKPAIQWNIDRITILRPIRHTQFKRNEISIRASANRSRINASDNRIRIQRTTVALRDVAYIIDAHFDMTDKSGPDDNPGKHLDQFNRRASRGQCWQRPSLAQREMIADRWGLPDPAAIPDTSLMGERDLGLMLHSLDYKTQRPRWFRAVMRDGVIKVPAVGSREVLH
jgi:CRISPR-associated protein Cas5d